MKRTEQNKFLKIFISVVLLGGLFYSAGVNSEPFANDEDLASSSSTLNSDMSSKEIHDVISSADFRKLCKGVRNSDGICTLKSDVVPNGSPDDSKTVTQSQLAVDAEGQVYLKECKIPKKQSASYKDMRGYSEWSIFCE